MSVEIAVAAEQVRGEILGPESAFAVARSAKRKEWAPVVESAKTITITDKESHELAVGHGRLLQASQKEVEALFTDAKRRIDALKKPILQAEKDDIDVITKAKNELGAKVQAYTREQERIALEARRAAEAEARRAEEERRLAEAIAAEQAGEVAEAEQILNEVSLPMPAIVQAPEIKVSGQVQKQTYSAVVTDLRALVKAVAAGHVPIQALKADEVFLNSQARNFREGLSYPGVEVKSNTSTHFRS